MRWCSASTKAVDPGLGTGDRLCSDQQRQDRSGAQEHLQAAWHGQPLRRPRQGQALEVATGVIRGKTTQTKKRVDFQAFMSEIIDDQPPDRQIHVILDNYCTHKRNETWLAAHPNVTFHFTPTSASGLNQVEI